MWTGENDSDTLRVDAYFFFSKTEKKSPFSKISGYLWMGSYLHEMLRPGTQEKKTNRNVLLLMGPNLSCYA